MAFTPEPARLVSLCAPAKINLFLHVGDKRADGFHDLESVAVFAEAGDRLQLSPGGDLKLTIGGPFGFGLSAGEDNLVMRAARALGTTNGAHIHLEKNLPVASGIGGGSADAAAALRGLNLLWGLGKSESELADIAASFGSDIPACVLSAPCWMAGRGERVERLKPLPPLALLLINPGVGVPTGPVFGALNARTGLGAISNVLNGIDTVWDMIAYLTDSENDLEAPAMSLAPRIVQVLEALDDEEGCVLARMSGSGATCFGLFEGRRSAKYAAENIAAEHPDWWIKPTRIARPDIGAPHWSSHNG